MRALIAVFCLIISTICFAAAQPPKGLLVFKPNNHVVLSEEINGRTASQFLSSFLKLEGNTRLLYISSPGGSVIDGMKMIQVISDEKLHKNLRVVCYVDAAASMAFALTQAVCDERHGGLTSALMQHQATYGVDGTDNQIISRLKMIASILKVLDTLQAKRLNISVEELRRRSADEWWTVGQEAVEARTLDNVSPAVCTKDLVEKTRDLKIATFFFVGVAKFSECPLITGPVAIIPAEGYKVNEHIRKSLERQPLSERVIKVN